MIVPPNHAVIGGIKIALNTVSAEVIRRGVIITGAGKAVTVLHYFKFYIPVVDFPLPNAGNGLGISYVTREDSGAKQQNENRYFQNDSL